MGEEIFHLETETTRDELLAPQNDENMRLYRKDTCKVVGFSEDEAVATFSAAAAWRIIARGRALLIERMKLIAENAQNAIEVFSGQSQEEVRQVIRAMPQVLAVSLTQSRHLSLLEHAARQLSESGGTLGRVRMRERTGDRRETKAAR